ncbi:hypothetical protein [Legionella sp. 29fVS95]|uniref:hypothetical protein n=1 Tax=Legionella sp. 29fVS95 TaxID=3402813 RepID=UPI003AF6DA3A
MPRVKGKGPILKANFVGKGKSKKNFSDLSSTTNLMLLSIVGNEYCAGEYLEAALKYSLRHHQYTTLLIADEVYWHNLKPQSSEEAPLSQEKINQLKQNALQLGAEYFESNLKHFLAPLGISAENFNKVHGDKSTKEKITLINSLARRAGLSFQIVGWQDWTDSLPDFQKNRVAIRELYQTTEQLKKSIEHTAHEFAKRHEQEGGYDLWYQRSVGYLTEESPAVMWLGAALGYNFVTYPGDMIDTFQATKDYFVVPSTLPPQESPSFAIRSEQPNLLVNWMQTYFKRESPKPETTVTASHPLHFFTPKPDQSVSAVVGSAITGAMLESITFASEPQKQKFDHAVTEFSNLLFSLQSKDRKNLLDLMMRLSVVAEMIQDYQGQQGASLAAHEDPIVAEQPIVASRAPAQQGIASQSTAVLQEEGLDPMPDLEEVMSELTLNNPPRQDKVTFFRSLIEPKTSASHRENVGVPQPDSSLARAFI